MSNMTNHSTHVVPGLYVNKLGAELVVTRILLRTPTHLTLGTIYEAETTDELIEPDKYLVTAESLRRYGYVLVKETTVE